MKTHRCLPNSLSILPLLFLLPGTALPAPVEKSPVEKTNLEKQSADAPLVSDKIREAMQDRRYADAVTAIDEAVQAKDAPKDYLLFLKGRALHLDGKYDDAIAVFDQLGKEDQSQAGKPDVHPWARRARFAKAVSLARKGDFRSAEVIYRAEAEYLLSADRKQQIADIYLEFADTYFKPPKDEQKPDYAKALEFYKKALEAGAKPEKQIEIELLDRPVPTESRSGKYRGHALRAVHQGSSSECLGYRSPLAVGDVPPGGGQSPRGPAGLAGPAGQVC